MSFELGFYVTPSPERIKKELTVLQELGIKHIGTDGFAEWRDSDYTDEIGSIISRSGMNLHSFHAPFGLVFSRKDGMDRSIADNRRIIDVAASWGARNIVWHFRWLREEHGDTHFAGTEVMDSMPGHEIDSLMAEVLKPTCEYAAQKQININLENMPLFPWAKNCDEILEFIRKQEHANLGFIYDIGHAWCSNIEPEAPIRNAGGLLNDTHFHDNFGWSEENEGRLITCQHIPYYDSHLPIGLGTINWVKVIAALQSVGYQGPVIFEGPSLKGHPERGTVAHFKRSVSLTINNWKAFEELVECLPDEAELGAYAPK